VAIALILRNPNFPVLGFKPITVFKLWGEFFLWAISVINLKPCPRFPLKTRYEVYHGVVPNMQDIRLLPIGCVLIVVRSPATEKTAGVMCDGVIVNENTGTVGLYVGPAAPTTPGAARVAVMSNGKLRILITNNFRAGTDGGGLNVYPHIERGLKQLLTDQIAAGVMNEMDEVEVEPEEYVPMQIDKQQTEVDASVQGSSQQPVELSDGAQGPTKRRKKTRGGKRGRPRKQVEVATTPPVQESSTVQTSTEPSTVPVRESTAELQAEIPESEPSAEQQAEVSGSGNDIPS
jgi:hypothetical protein